MTDEYNDRAIGFLHGDRMPEAVIVGHARGHDLRSLLARAQRRRKANERTKQAQGAEALYRCFVRHGSVPVPQFRLSQ
jgi:hypothetical protein